MKKLLIICSILISLFVAPVYARTEVIFNSTQDNGIQHVIISGKDEAGNQLWTRELYDNVGQMLWIRDLGEHNGRYYYNERGTLICIDPETGNELWRHEGYNMLIQSLECDKNGYLYLSGSWGQVLYVVSDSGEKIGEISEIDGGQHCEGNLWVCEDGSVNIEMLNGSAKDRRIIKVNPAAYGLEIPNNTCQVNGWELVADLGERAESGQCGDEIYWWYTTSGDILIYGDGDVWSYSQDEDRKSVV